MRLNEKIKQFRQALGITQQELAALVGYTDRSSIAKIEKGQVDISQSKLEQFAKVFHISPGELLDDIADDYFQNVEQYISDREMRLIGLYNDLNAEGQDKLLEYAEDLDASGRYKKRDELEMVD